MSQIKSKGTKPEILVRKFLHRNGFRFRLHKKGLPGTPDIILKKYRTVIFVHGCFFHAHECKTFKWPVNNSGFWKNKLNNNVTRDKQVKKELKGAGWEVITLWECKLKPKTRNRELQKLISKLFKKNL